MAWYCERHRLQVEDYRTCPECARTEERDRKDARRARLEAVRDAIGRCAEAVVAAGAVVLSPLNALADRANSAADKTPVWRHVGQCLMSRILQFLAAVLLLVSRVVFGPWPGWETVVTVTSVVLLLASVRELPERIRKGFWEMKPRSRPGRFLHSLLFWVFWSAEYSLLFAVVALNTLWYVLVRAAGKAVLRAAVAPFLMISEKLGDLARERASRQSMERLQRKWDDEDRRGASELTKRCSRCGARVHERSRPGDVCSHCGALWNFER